MFTRPTSEHQRLGQVKPNPSIFLKDSYITKANDGFSIRVTRLRGLLQLTREAKVETLMSLKYFRYRQVGRTAACSKLRLPARRRPRTVHQDRRSGVVRGVEDRPDQVGTLSIAPLLMRRATST